MHCYIVQFIELKGYDESKPGIWSLLSARFHLHAETNKDGKGRVQAQSLLSRKAHKCDVS